MNAKDGWMNLKTEVTDDSDLLHSRPTTRKKANKKNTIDYNMCKVYSMSSLSSPAASKMRT